jgi:hypothetical protein
MTKLRGVLLSVCWMAVGYDVAAAAGAPEMKTAEAVKAADAAWLQAELDGDYQFLDSFLLDGYRSIDASGAVFSKAALIASRRNRGKSAAFAQAVQDWKAAHPNHAEVALYDNTAVLTWVSDEVKSTTPVYSCDIFVYRDGHWHAIYSQHSNAETAAPSKDRPRRFTSS